MKEYNPEPIKYGVSAHCYKLMQEAGKDVSMFEVFQHIESDAMPKGNLTTIPKGWEIRKYDQKTVLRI